MSEQVVPGDLSARVEDASVQRPSPVRCCIAGCGPAGAMAGFLLARAGVPVLVLEKHGDFLRDFRGDTIHPSTLEILDELGLADRFLQLPHSRLSNISLAGSTGDELSFSLARLRTRFRYIAMVPQWDFLQFITAEARKLPTFELRMNAEITGLIEENGRVRGVKVREGTIETEVRAPLTIGADGRSSVTRRDADLPMVASAPPMDVLWFRLSRRPDDADALVGRLGRGAGLVMINRNEYWQTAFIVPKGTADELKARGLEAFRRSISDLNSGLADRVSELQSWDQVKLLSVRADRLTRWYKPGYLAIGDAAHAMSPVGGVGINLAIQDAVAAANILWRELSDGRAEVDDLRRVQRERERPVRVIQAVQSFVQNRILRKALADEFTFPWIAHLAARTPIVRDIPARLVAFGFGRPHVRTPDAQIAGPS